MKNLVKLINSLLLISILFIKSMAGAEEISSTVLDKAKKSIVTINTRIALSAYKNVGSWSGTGFITDKSNGFIVTNNHVVGKASIGTYCVTFYNGQKAEAKLVYYDNWQDYAILKINPTEIPSSSEEIIFSASTAKLNQSVLVVGNTEAQDFSFHTGYISSLYEINGEMPQCSYVINLNTAGGASGSPVLNDKNEAIGVLYGGGKTYAFALNSRYVIYALAALKKGEMPSRKHMGIISELYSLDAAVKHRHFPKDQMTEYLKKFPDARNRVVHVQSIMAGSTANGILKAGDIIWEIDGNALGGSLVVLDKAMDEAVDNSAKLTIYRDGQRIETTVKLYDVNKYKVSQMLDFAGAIFFETDDYASAKSGAPLGSLAITNVQTGSSFSKIPVPFIFEDKSLYRVVVRSIGGYKVKSLDDLIKIVPDIVNQKYVDLKFKNYLPYYQEFDRIFVSSQDEFVTDITFSSVEAKPRILKYNATIQEWVAEDIVNSNQNIPPDHLAKD